MKQFLKKPLGLAVAATLAMGGMAVYTNASAATDANALGDLALVPYYTVRDNFVTGVHITNTSDQTQVVKLRLRRGSDSADALDFNLIMSPFDVWVGTINDDDGVLGISSSDNTCTAPQATGTDSNGKPKWEAPDVFAANGAADEGYLEVIGMAAADEDQPISVAALHGSDGTPRSCLSARSNFFIANQSGPAATTSTAGPAATQGDSVYEETGNVLKVSYFIRDAATGMEMGDNATHIVDFSDEAMMTHQQGGLNNGLLTGFDFPDLDGGIAGQRGLYDSSIRLSLGADAIMNDWSFNATNGVSTDWVVTIPGQYLMDDPSDNGSVIVDGTSDVTNHRDLPVTAAFAVYDREEATPTEEEGGLVISPSPEVEVPTTEFERETNVIEWGGNKVFNTVAPTKVDPGLANSTGWAALSISSNTVAPLIYDQTDVTGGTSAAPINGIPVIGFTAWQRTFTDASKNYGRIVGHSRINPTP
ncbi:hypothetical protein GCM10009133_35320 [Cocleimonas flava]|uniref:Uncharacterized protein n=1 Tax=Cocleimonas flava TaxID=634765 RepID=A0A4V2P982_9GAMM|nr:hypothetical protein [Cocleimonas flava]TCJ88625.1 hypothetical protein EV695_0483 [Cocleimonas flava]